VEVREPDYTAEIDLQFQEEVELPLLVLLTF
jgi:hypothetical protein